MVAELVVSPADLLLSSSDLLESSIDLVRSGALRGGPETCRVGDRTDRGLSVSDLGASAPVLRASGASLLHGKPDLSGSVHVLFVSPHVLCELAEDLRGHVQCRIPACELEVRSRRVRSQSNEVRLRSRACRFRLVTAEHGEIAEDSRTLAVEPKRTRAGAWAARVGHLVSLTNGTARVPNFRQTIFGSTYDFVGPPHAAPRNREIARGPETMRRKGVMSGNRPSFVMRRR